MFVGHSHPITTQIYVIKLPGLNAEARQIYLSLKRPDEAF